MKVEDITVSNIKLASDSQLIDSYYEEIVMRMELSSKRAQEIQHKTGIFQGNSPEDLLLLDKHSIVTAEMDRRGI